MEYSSQWDFQLMVGCEFINYGYTYDYLENQDIILFQSFFNKEKSKECELVYL